MIFMDDFVSYVWDYNVWDYTYDNNQIVLSVPNKLCKSLKALSQIAMAKYTPNMLLLIDVR